MQNKENYNTRVEQDIERCRQDVLKAVQKQNNSDSSSDLMPSFEDILKKQTHQIHPPLRNAGEKEFISNMVEKISHPQQQDRSEQMPSLDLGNQILAQQRKVAALKRKSPGQENVPKPQPEKQQTKPLPIPIMSMPPAPASPQHQIIADIVAKEILVLSAAR